MANSACGFSKNILTNIEIALSPVVRSALTPSQVGFDMYRFGWYERQVQENSAARDWLGLRFWKARLMISLLELDNQCSNWRRAILECIYCVIECLRVPRSDHGGLSGSRTKLKNLTFCMTFWLFLRVSGRLPGSFSDVNNVSQRPGQHGSDCGFTSRANGYTLKNLTVS